LFFQIFHNYVIILVERNDGYYIKYYAGELVMKEVQEKISLEEAEKAQLSERDAYEVLILLEKKNKHSG